VTPSDTGAAPAGDAIVRLSAAVRPSEAAASAILVNLKDIVCTPCFVASGVVGVRPLMSRCCSLWNSAGGSDELLRDLEEPNAP
jgi:hypothetical protein